MTDKNPGRAKSAFEFEFAGFKYQKSRSSPFLAVAREFAVAKRGLFGAENRRRPMFAELAAPFFLRALDLSGAGLARCPPRPRRVGKSCLAHRTCFLPCRLSILIWSLLDPQAAVWKRAMLSITACGMSTRPRFAAFTIVNPAAKIWYLV